MEVKMEEDRISYHESVRKIYNRINKDKLDNIWERYEAQGMRYDPDRKGPFCQAGNRCDLCSIGPYRADV